MKGILSKALKSRFLRSAGTLSSGAAISQMIAFGTSPILTRLYSPEAYGVFALMLAFVTFALALVSLHYEMAIALPAKNEDAASVTALAIILAGVVSSIAVVLFAPWGFNLLASFGFTKLINVWWLLPATILASALHQALQLWHLRRERYKEVAANGVVHSLTLNTAPILLSVSGLSSIGLLIGLVAARCASAIGLLTRAIRRDRTLIAASFSGLRRVAGDYRSFPTVGLPGAVLHIACFQLPAFLLVDLFGADIAGFYLLQDRVLGAPLAVVAQGVASVFYVNAAKLAVSNGEELKNQYFKMMRNLALAGLVPALILILAGPWLFKIIFGANWERAGEFARIMAVPMFLRFIGGPLYRCLTILKAQKWILVCDGAGCVGMLAILSYFSGNAENGVAGVSGIAAAISLTYAGLIGAASYEVCKHATRPRTVEPSFAAK